MIPSPMNSMPDVKNMQLQQSMNEDSSTDKEQYIKHPSSAFNLWYHHRKEELMRTLPDLFPFEIKKIFAEWKLLPAAEKQPFIEAKTLKEQHVREQRTLQPQQNMNENSWADNQQFIKRPMNSYILWCRHRRRELIKTDPNLHSFKITRQLAAEWRHLPTNQKKPFIDEAQRLREKHKIDHPDYIYMRPRNQKSLEKSTESAVVPNSLSPALDREALKSNPKISAFDEEDKRNDPKGSFPAYLMTSTPHIEPSYVSKPHSTGSQTFTSMADINVRSKAVVTYDYKVTYSSQNARRQELNPGDSAHSNTSSSSLVQHIYPESEHHNEDSPLDLSIRKDR